MFGKASGVWSASLWKRTIDPFLTFSVTLLQILSGVALSFQSKESTLDTKVKSFLSHFNIFNYIIFLSISKECLYNFCSFSLFYTVRYLLSCSGMCLCVFLWYAIRLSSLNALYRYVRSSLPVCSFSTFKDCHSPCISIKISLTYSLYGLYHLSLLPL